MKKVFVFFALLISAYVFTSCNQNQPKSSIVEQQIRVIEPEFFYVVKEVVKAGYNTWDRAKVHYGSGFMWRDIVAQNKFLQEPGRVWQDKVSGIWYCLIRPGEELIIGTTKVNPVFIENIDAPTKENVVKAGEIISTPPLMPWWEWLISFLVVAVVVALFVILFRISNNSNPPTATATATATATTNANPSAINVIIRDGLGIDLSTAATLLARDQDFQDRALDILADSAKKNELSKLSIDKVDNQLIMKAKFFDRGKQEPAPVADKTEPAPVKPVEQTEEGK